MIKALQTLYDLMVGVVQNYDFLVEIIQYYTEHESKFENLVDLLKQAAD